MEGFGVIVDFIVEQLIRIIKIIPDYGPFFIALASLVFSIRAERNSSLFQHQIAKLEHKYFIRSSVYNIYSEFSSFECIRLIVDGDVFEPTRVWTVFNIFRAQALKLNKARDQLRLLLSNDKSLEAQNLKKAVEEGFDNFSILEYSLSTYLASDKYKTSIAQARKETGIDKTNNFDDIKRKQFISIVTSSEEFRKIDDLMNKYLESTNDKNFGIYFNRYIEKLQ